jgi:uncharacterized PurR-regulated membrane protein YhhQ (DUF165 family)
VPGGDWNFTPLFTMNLVHNLQQGLTARVLGHHGTQTFIVVPYILRVTIFSLGKFLLFDNSNCDYHRTAISAIEQPEFKILQQSFQTRYVEQLVNISFLMLLSGAKFGFYADYV